MTHANAIASADSIVQPLTGMEIANRVWAAESDWLGQIRNVSDGVQDFPGVAPVYIRSFLEGCSYKRAELLNAIIRKLSEPGPEKGACK